MQTMAPMKRLIRPENPRPIDITPRDEDMMSFVARTGLATSDQIARFVGGSEKNLGERLKLLFWHQYLNRPEQQRTHLALFPDLGNVPLIYALGSAGKKHLAMRGLHTRKQSRAKAPLLAHNIATAETVLAFALASRADGAPRLLDDADLLPLMPEATRMLQDPFRFRVTVRDRAKDITLNVVPDRLLSLVYADNHRHNFCLEVDLGTMTIAARRNGHIHLTGKSTFARKHAGFFNGWNEGKHRTQWGWQGFRVLTVAPSEARISHMIDAQREIAKGASALFLYTTPTRMAAHGAFAPIWISSESDGISIIDRK